LKNTAFESMGILKFHGSFRVLLPFRLTCSVGFSAIHLLNLLNDVPGHHLHHGSERLPWDYLFSIPWIRQVYPMGNQSFFIVFTKPRFPVALISWGPRVQASRVIAGNGHKSFLEFFQA
jgi:hypothetical protein